MAEAISKSGRWVWELTDPGRSGGAGDLANLFRNERVDQPGILAVDPPRPEETLMAREVLQNSWDAADELQKERSAAGERVPSFGITFEFEELDGVRREELERAADLSGLRRQMEAVRSEADVSTLGMRRTAVLEDSKAQNGPLRILRVVESGTTGMYGPFVGAQSKMFLALISIGYTVKAAGSGGSYGYGKAGLIAASATRTVFAYSCFEPRANDRVDGQPVTRRFLGMTYWGQHTHGGTSFTGFARLGKDDGVIIAPFVNEEADAMAQRLGIDLRTHEDDRDLGTTFVLLDPLVEPEGLKSALERNWWPAIREGRFTPVITEQKLGAAPSRHIPRPIRNPILAPFVRAYELATVPQDNIVPHELRADLSKTPSRLGGLEVGSLGIVADLEGWSYASQNTEGDDEQAESPSSLIALTRGPRMVVQYYEPQRMRSSPYVRGVFVADTEIDDLLRQTEPKAHDSWVTSLDRIDEVVDERAPSTAKHALQEIGRVARRFQQSLRPPLPPAEDVQLTALAQLFKSMGRGKGIIDPLKSDRLVSIETHTELHPTESSQSVFAGVRVTLSLHENYEEADLALVRVRIIYKLLEDGKAGAAVPLTQVGRAELGEPNEDGSFDIAIGRTSQHLELESEAYSADWSGRLIVSAKVLRPLSEGMPS